MKNKEYNQKYKERRHILHKSEYKNHIELKNKRNNKQFTKQNIAEVRKPYHGVNGILTCYHIRCDPYLGLGRYEIRIIPSDFIELINSVCLQWYPYLAPKYQPRYSSVTQCKYYQILGKHNYWLMVYFIDNGTDDQECGSVQKLYYMVC